MTSTASKILEFTMQAGNGWQRVHASRLSRLHTTFLKHLRSELSLVATHIVRRLSIEYAKHSSSPRTDGGPSIEDRLTAALVYQISKANQRSELNLGVFNLHQADVGTGMAQWGDPEGGWFDLFEDGHIGLEHGSENYGFISIDKAMHKAEQCIESVGLQGPEANALRHLVQEKFQGKYGLGIMVRLKAPLFFDYPEFGSAYYNGVDPHPGYLAWNTVRQMHGWSMSGAANTVPYAIKQAAIKTINSLGHVSNA